jgi:hypothetical protein
MKVWDLRTLLHLRGLSITDRKELLVERLATAAAGEMEEVQEEQHSRALQNSSPTRVDTAAFTITAAEESTPVDFTTMRLAGDGNKHVCLDTARYHWRNRHPALFRDDGKFYGGSQPHQLDTNRNPIYLIPIGLDTVAIFNSRWQNKHWGLRGRH